LRKRLDLILYDFLLENLQLTLNERDTLSQSTQLQKRFFSLHASLFADMRREVVSKAGKYLQKNAHEFLLST
jgi:hypothetical protein